MAQRISTEHFFFQTAGRSFFNEVTMIPGLSHVPFEGPMPRRITLVSQWTGMEIEMVCEGPRIVHGDIVDWTFRPIDKDALIRNVVIVND